MNTLPASDTPPRPDNDGAQPEQHPAEIPPSERKHDAPGEHKGGKDAPWPPDSIPNPMPGVDPQQTPGIDRLGAYGPSAWWQ
ncbi:hypothetical protein [Achromobacter marplatensis]|jgi:hypothetical protein|uniref:hypothetical protein n=1 Tax=Achromobacter marplatensis TaxID=470868 RepID=UPI003C77EA90